MNSGFVVVVIGVCLTSLSWCHTPSSGHCFTRDSFSICYTAYNEPLDQRQAVERCKQRHPDGGRLAIIRDATEHEKILKALDGTAASKFWIGAEIKFYDNWTWVDGTYFDPADFVRETRSRKHGFGRLRESGNVVGILEDEAWISSSKGAALCKLNECSPTESPSCYSTVAATHWYEGRNRCLSQKEDLAVVSQTTRQRLLNAAIISANNDYFIGLSNIKVMWQLSNISDMSSPLTKTGKDEIEATYTNWTGINGLRYLRYGNKTCVVVAENAKWDVEECTAEHPFICEYRGSPTDHPESSHSGSSRGIAAGVVVLMIAVIAVSAVLYGRFKSKCRSVNEFDRLMSTDSPNASEIPDLRVVNGAPYATIASADEAPTGGTTHRGYQPVVLYASLEPKEDGYVSMNKVVK